MVAFGFQESGVEAMSVSEEERRRVSRRTGTRATASGSCSARSATSPPTRRRTRPRRRSSASKIERDRHGSGDRPQAHPDRPVRQAPAVQRGLLRDVQPGQRRAGVDQGEPDRGESPRRGAHGRRRRARARCADLRHRLRRRRRQLPVDGPARPRRASTSTSTGPTDPQLPRLSTPASPTCS